MRGAVEFLCNFQEVDEVKKFLLMISVLALVLFILWLEGAGRLWLIRVTLHSNLPEWLKAFLWGWY